MNHPFPALEALRETSAHTLPLGVPLEVCTICDKQILKHEDATVFQELRNGPSYMVHQKCHTDHLQRLVRAMGRHGGGRMGAALRLDR